MCSSKARGRHLKALPTMYPVWLGITIPASTAVWSNNSQQLLGPGYRVNVLHNPDKSAFRTAIEKCDVSMVWPQR